MKQLPHDVQMAASTLMLKFSLLAAGAVACAVWPLVLLLMVIRDRVDGCSWEESDIGGEGRWSFIPPQLECRWSEAQFPAIDAWAEATGGSGPDVEADVTFAVALIPVTPVAWFAFFLFLFGLALMRAGQKMQVPEVAAPQI